MMLKNLARCFHTNRSQVGQKLILVYQEMKENEVSAALARRICAQLREVYINALETDKLVECSQVPCTVIISERTLTEGVLEIQHFNPRIREQVHVSNLTDRLLLQQYWAGSTGSGAGAIAKTLRCTDEGQAGSSAHESPPP